MQPNEEQVVPEGQTLPHFPQLLSSKFLSMHVPLQKRLPDPHAQVPSLQNCPSPEQELPHLPQLLPSYFISTHFPSQSTSSSTHPHVPLTQERPAGQTFPHEPHADSSFFRSAQCVPLHRVIPFGQDAVWSADKLPIIPKLNNVRTDKIIQLTCIFFIYTHRRRHLYVYVPIELHP